MPDSEDENIEDVVESTPKIFINYVDTYSAGVIGKLLSQSYPGVSQQDFEGEEEEEVGGDDDQDGAGRRGGGKDLFKVYGTILDPETAVTFPFEVVENDPIAIENTLKECDIIIYSLGEGEYVAECQAAFDFLQQEMATMGNKTIILVSTCLTWAKTKPMDQDDPDIPFTEDDYRKRRPHPNFKEHIQLEKLAIKIGRSSKGKYQCYVICCGILYGAGEHTFHWLFKRGWMGEQSLPIYGTGTNVIPTLHVQDLAKIILNTIDSKPKTRYILATDQSKSTLREIVKAISSRLTTGKVNIVGKEDGQASNDISQISLDALEIDLRMESVLVREELTFKWICDDGMVEKIEDIVKEYKKCRGLLPIRICILGPPGVGKTEISKQLAAYYKIHHITTRELIDETIERLTTLSNKDQTEMTADEDEDDDESAKIEQAAEFLMKIRENFDQNNGRLDEAILNEIYRQKLKSKPALNQGTILDGYPKTYDQAKALNEPIDDDGETGDGSYDPDVVPELVVDLTATEDFLKNRMMNLPEEIVQGTHNTEEGFIRRLAEFSTLRAEEDTVINWFDQVEIDPVTIDVTQGNNDAQNSPIIQIIKKIIKSPRNYGLTAEEKEAEARRELAEREAAEAKERAEREQREFQEREQRKHNIEIWSEQLEEVRRQEREREEERAIPFRQYVMKNVMPTLSAGLLECCKIRPDDPIDFLAEYLYQNNPELD